MITSAKSTPQRNGAPTRSPWYRRRGLLAGAGIVGLIAVSGLWVSVLWAHLRVATVELAYRTECKERGLAELRIEEAQAQFGEGLGFSPPQFAVGRWVNDLMMSCEVAMSRDPVLALRLLEDESAAVRGWTVFLIMSAFIKLPDERVVAKCKELALGDDDPRVRHVALEMFDDPFESTEPHLELTAAEGLRVLEGNDSVSRELLLHLVGKGRCYIEIEDGRGKDAVFRACVAELESEVPQRRWLAYGAARRLCRDDRLGEVSMRGAFGGQEYTESLAMRFWMTCPGDVRRGTIVAIQDEMFR